MADAEEEKSEKSAGGIFDKWKGMKGWQKAGVLIGAGALVFAGLAYFQQKNSAPGDNGDINYSPGITPGSSYGTGYPGEYDYHPSLPTTPASGGTTGTTTANMKTLMATGWLTNIPGGTRSKEGKNLVNLQPGTQIQILGNPVSAYGQSYLPVIANGQTGYINTKVKTQ